MASGPPEGCRNGSHSNVILHQDRSFVFIQLELPMLKSTNRGQNVSVSHLFREMLPSERKWALCLEQLPRGAEQVCSSTSVLRCDLSVHWAHVWLCNGRVRTMLGL